jgi:hypothetical protein
MEQRKVKSVIPFDRARAKALLAEARDEADRDGWDGAGSKAVAPEVFRSAQRFIDLLPDDLETPEIVADPDGEIEFEWSVTPWRVVSICMGDGGRLGYIAFFGQAEKVRGSMTFGDFMPPIIPFLLNRLFSSSE